jgi:hypothetical protein
MAQHAPEWLWSLTTQSRKIGKSFGLGDSQQFRTSGKLEIPFGRSHRIPEYHGFSRFQLHVYLVIISIHFHKISSSSVQGQSISRWGEIVR